MKHFKKSLGIENEEIVVVVVYDGIDRINDDIDPDENMVQYFEYIHFNLINVLN